MYIYNIVYIIVLLDNCTSRTHSFSGNHTEIIIVIICPALICFFVSHNYKFQFSSSVFGCSLQLPNAMYTGRGVYRTRGWDNIYRGHVYVSVQLGKRRKKIITVLTAKLGWNHYTILMALSMCNFDIVFLTRRAVRRTAGFVCQHSVISLLSVNRIYRKEKDKHYCNRIAHTGQRRTSILGQSNLPDHFPIWSVWQDVSSWRRPRTSSPRSQDRWARHRDRVGRIARPWILCHRMRTFGRLPRGRGQPSTCRPS